MQHHKYSLSELDNIRISLEREIYITMLVSHIKEENEKARESRIEENG